MSSANSSTDTMTVKKSVEIPVEGGVTVPLSKINNTWVKNSRKKIGETGMKELIENLRVQGQLQPVVGCWNEDGSTINLVGGFRRTEALHQIALKRVVKEYN